MVLTAPKEGSLVVLQRLQGRKHLNGLVGTVVKHIDGSHTDSATQRCRVRVHGTPYSVKVLPENIALFEVERERLQRLPPEQWPADMYQLPTTIELQSIPEKVQDDGGEAHAAESSKKKAKARPAESLICTSRRQAPCGETYAAIQASPAGRDPRRLRNIGLSYFKDFDGDSHPDSAPQRRHGHRGASRGMSGIHRTDYDWRSKSRSTKYTDPADIPYEMGGHGAHMNIVTEVNVAAVNEALMAVETSRGENFLGLHPKLQAMLENDDTHASSLKKTTESGDLAADGGSVEAKGRRSVIFEDEMGRYGPTQVTSLPLNQMEPRALARPPHVEWSQGLPDGHYSESPLTDEMLLADEDPTSTGLLALTHLCDNLSREPDTLWEKELPAAAIERDPTVTYSNTSPTEARSVLERALMEPVSPLGMSLQENSATYTASYTAPSSATYTTSYTAPTGESGVFSSILASDESAIGASASDSLGRAAYSSQEQNTSEESRDRIRALAEAAHSSGLVALQSSSPDGSDSTVANAIHELAMSYGEHGDGGNQGDRGT
mmetsp:Transcript_37182/g.66086  ORF Transcript_37182/g.66086 Transcript_37182/m.66086 type:complete len:549 (-) Transcript_37182:11-1657(-)